MNIKKLMGSCLLLAAMVSLQAGAGNVTADAARSTANNFFKQHAAVTPGKFMAPSAADFVLTHVEPSATVNGANDFYAFNIKGGGFIIIAGEDRATQVLGYSDKGHLDFIRMPEGLKDLLDGYKEEMEYLRTLTDNDLVPMQNTFQDTGGVEPLIKTNWGQEMPYYLQCPVYQGEYCVVGCVATAMAQVMYYWRFPTSSNSISSYYCYDIGGNVPALPATTFDYSKMLPSYCHWDWDNSELIQDTYTDEQAQEVAKLSRYCGQAVEMGYSPEGSGAYTSDQLAAMKAFGYSSSAQQVSKSGWWSTNYTTEQWEDMMKTELVAGRPILYSASDPSAGGHAFICDGFNSEGYFHFNYGWYGTCDGWYISTSLRMTHRSGEALNFSSNHVMLTGVVPPNYCIVDAEVDASSELIVLGYDLNTVAQNVSLRTSYRNIKLQFDLTDEAGNKMVASDPVTVTVSSFLQGSNVNGVLNLPTTLASGNYNLNLRYYTIDANQLTDVATAPGQLVVVGNVAKYNEPFNITDVTHLIHYVLNDVYPSLNITDVTTLIHYVLNAE